MLFLSEDDEGLSGFWLYNQTCLLRRRSGISRNYQHLLEQIVKAPAARLDSFVVLNEEPKQEKMDQKNLKEARGNRLKVSGARASTSRVSSIKTVYLIHAGNAAAH